MIIAYGNYLMTFTIASSGGGAAFLTPSTYLNDAKNGVICSMQWDTGTQTTATHVDITVTVTRAMDTTPVIAACGFINVQLPAGTLVQFVPFIGAPISQRLVPGIRGELSAWWMPFASGAPFKISIFNDVNGSADITAGQVFGAGEIYAGRAVQLPTLATGGSGAPTSASQDLTGWNQANLGQLYPIMRVPQRIKRGQLGYNGTKDVAGSSSTIVASPSSAALRPSLNTLRDLLSTQQALAVCDLPGAGFGATPSQSLGFKFDQDFMQPNWMLARMKSAGDLALDQPPYWSWNPEFMEAR